MAPSIDSNANAGLLTNTFQNLVEVQKKAEKIEAHLLLKQEGVLSLKVGSSTRQYRVAWVDGQAKVERDASALSRFVSHLGDYFSKRRGWSSASHAKQLEERLNNAFATAHNRYQTMVKADKVEAEHTIDANVAIKKLASEACKSLKEGKTLIEWADRIAKEVVTIKSNCNKIDPQIFEKYCVDELLVEIKKTHPKAAEALGKALVRPKLIKLGNHLAEEAANQAKIDTKMPSDLQNFDLAITRKAVATTFNSSVQKVISEIKDAYGAILDSKALAAVQKETFSAIKTDLGSVQEILHQDPRQFNGNIKQAKLDQSDYQYMGDFLKEIQEKTWANQVRMDTLRNYTCSVRVGGKEIFNTADLKQLASGDSIEDQKKFEEALHKRMVDAASAVGIKDNPLPKAFRNAIVLAAGQTPSNALLGALHKKGFSGAPNGTQWSNSIDFSMEKNGSVKARVTVSGHMNQMRNFVAEGGFHGEQPTVAVVAQRNINLFVPVGEFSQRLEARHDFVVDPQGNQPTWQQGEFDQKLSFDGELFPLNQLQEADSLRARPKRQKQAFIESCKAGVSTWKTSGASQGYAAKHLQSELTKLTRNATQSYDAFLKWQPGPKVAFPSDAIRQFIRDVSDKRSGLVKVGDQVLNPTMIYEKVITKLKAKSTDEKIEDRQLLGDHDLQKAFHQALVAEIKALAKQTGVAERFIFSMAATAPLQTLDAIVSQCAYRSDGAGWPPVAGTSGSRPKMEGVWSFNDGQATFTYHYKADDLANQVVTIMDMEGKNAHGMIAVEGGKASTTATAIFLAMSTGLEPQGGRIEHQLEISKGDFQLL